MNICIQKMASFFPALFCWEGMIFVNEKENREGAKQPSSHTHNVTSHWGLELQSSFNSFTEPGNEGALPI